MHIRLVQNIETIIYCMKNNDDLKQIVSHCKNFRVFDSEFCVLESLSFFLKLVYKTVHCYGLFTFQCHFIVDVYLPSEVAMSEVCKIG